MRVSASTSATRARRHSADVLHALVKVCLFGGFNTMTEADLGALYLLALCPEAKLTGRVRAADAAVAESEMGCELDV